MPPSSEIHFLSQRFDEFDAFAATAASWQVHFNQLDRGRFVGEMKQIAAGPVTVIRCQFNRKLHQSGCAPPGCWTFAVPLPDHSSHVWRRHEVTSNNLTSFRDDVEMECTSLPGFHIYAVSISSELLARAAQDLGYENHEEILKREQVIHCLDRHLEKIRLYCDAATNCDEPHPGFAISLQTELPKLILQGFIGAKGKLPIPISLKRRRALRLASEAIRDSGEAILKVSDLCRVTQASERTLRYAFAESFGVSPKEYLQSVRLNAVHRDLLNHDPGTLIADLANRQGFWHMGQFASDYRRMFAELPSATLLRACER